MKRKFTTSLAKFGKARLSGFGGSSDLNPGDVAEQIFGEKMDGPHLFAYLFRRFGYPNIGWDDYKNLVCYALTTPMPGLYLTVTPYLGNTTSIHFGCLMNYPTRRRMEKIRWDRCEKHRLVKDRWMRQKLTFGKLEPGEKREVLWEQEGEDKKPTGWILTWKQVGDHKTKWPKKFSSGWGNLVDWVIGDIYRKHHPEPESAKNKRMARNKRVRENWRIGPRNIIYKMNQALEAALLDLKTGTNVRDHNFNAVEGGDHIASEASYYKHAGSTAGYLARRRLVP